MKSFCGGLLLAFLVGGSLAAPHGGHATSYSSVTKHEEPIHKSHGYGYDHGYGGYDVAHYGGYALGHGGHANSYVSVKQLH